jgi:bifunctional DNA-binding transcriptional regulator/antitoxin component of YhaV-PrlF toxin-antitoxin module
MVLAKHIDVLNIGQNGQITVPVGFRKDLSIGKGGKLVSVRMGDALVLIPQDSLLESISLLLQESMNASGVSVQKLKSGALEQRAQIVKERHGHLVKPVREAQ